jgi:IS5 family transposase
VFEKQLYKWCKLIEIKRPRSKYIEQKRIQRAYDRRRKKTYKQGQKRIKSLLYLLEKGLNQFQKLKNSYPQIQLTEKEASYLITIKKVLSQQQYLRQNPGQQVKDRIVSLHKPYIRPIKRGKENKPNEFGLKVHMLQVDGVCFIDEMNFNAFNEGTRLKVSVLKHKNFFKTCNQLAADGIYANNANRSYLTSKGIFTSFPKKGPKVNNPNEDKLRGLLSKQRATVMEGSFGIHKTSYGLQKIKAKSAKTEKLWVFFGVMTANAVLISRRKEFSPPDYQQVA